MLWLVGRSRSRSDRWWDADQAFPVRGHGHTMKPALTGMTLVSIPLLVSSVVSCCNLNGKHSDTGNEPGTCVRTNVPCRIHRGWASGRLALHRTRGGHTASKPIDHMWSTQHHVRHSEALIWIEFRVKQLTLMPATCREHRGYAQHETLGTPPVLTLEHRG